MIEKGTPVLALISNNEEVAAHTRGNVMETVARGASAITIVEEGVAREDTYLLIRKNKSFVTDKLKKYKKVLTESELFYIRKWATQIVGFGPITLFTFWGFGFLLTIVFHSIRFSSNRNDFRMMNQAVQ